MTMYQDIYQDLPSRVHEVWQRTRRASDNARDLSVTAMLMAAATGLSMPWESLKDVGVGNRDDWNAHPSFVNGAQAHYKSVLDVCNQFLSQKISDTASLQSISLRECANLSEICDAAECGNKGQALELKERKVRDVVRILRNALSHNNIVAFGASNDRIEKLGFFSENRAGSGCTSTLNGYHLVTLTVSEFQNFLDAWFSMLQPQKQDSK